MTAPARLRRSSRGFTLLELLVALSIFALVSVIAYTGLQTTLTTRDQVQAGAERLNQLQRTFSIIEQDLTQAINRSIRDRFGDPRAPMLTELGSLEWTRGGQANPLGLERASLQRVGYLLEDDTLVRQLWLALDQPYEPQTRSTELLTGVEELEFRFLDENRDWLDDWPPADSTAAPLPRVVEIRLELTDLGSVSRLFLLPF